MITGCHKARKSQVTNVLYHISHYYYYHKSHSRMISHITLTIIIRIILLAAGARAPGRRVGVSTCSVSRATAPRSLCPSVAALLVRFPSVPRCLVLPLSVLAVARVVSARAGLCVYEQLRSCTRDAPHAIVPYSPSESGLPHSHSGQSSGPNNPPPSFPVALRPSPTRTVMMTSCCLWICWQRHENEQRLYAIKYPVPAGPAVPRHPHWSFARRFATVDRRAPFCLNSPLHVDC